jgi:pSer/pThr/pTyr-binding forkhead associated (FHA) protein
MSGILVGRAPACTLVLDDEYTSSRHARVFPQYGEWWVEDLGSTNGTFVDDMRIVEPTAVEPGTPIRVGQSTLELQR